MVQVKLTAVLFVVTLVSVPALIAGSVPVDDQSTSPSTLATNATNATNETGRTMDHSSHNTSISASSDDLALELAPSDCASTLGTNFSQETCMLSNQNITFNDGDDYRVVVHDEDTGGEVTITPEDGTWNGSHNFGIFMRNANGSLRDHAMFWWTSGNKLELHRTVDGSITTSGLVNQSVSLVDARTGESIARTEAQPYVVGYDHEPSLTVTPSTVNVSLPREPFPKDSNVSLMIYDILDESSMSPRTTVELSYDSGRDAFVGHTDLDELQPGNYSYRLQVDHPTGITVDRFAESINKSYRDEVPLVIPEDPADQSPITLGGPSSLSATPGSTVNATLTLTNRQVADASSGGIQVASVADPITVRGSRAVFLGLDRPIPEPGESLQHTVTFEVPDGTSPGTYPVETEAAIGDAWGTHNATITVSDVDRFDRNDPSGEIGFQDVLDAIGAYNAEETVGGDSVSFRDILDVIEAYNQAS